jgi:hypothetical protein
LSVLDPIQTHIAFLHETVIIELRSTKLTGLQTNPAAVTFVLIDQDDAIRTLVYSLRGTNTDAGGLGAMLTGNRIEPPAYIRKDTASDFFHSS